MLRLFYPILVIVAIVMLASCSNGGRMNPASGDLLSKGDLSDAARVILGYYTVSLDPNTGSATVVPDRELNFHMNAESYLTGWPCGNCLRLKNIQFLPDNIVECDIEVQHPYPNPVFTVFDLRVIAMFPAEKYFYGVGVSTALTNRDGLTTLWDNPGIPGLISGYKAYNKGETRRPFGPGDIFSEHFIVKLPSGSISYDLGVDASWAPNDGVNFPIEMNSFEPINLSGSVGPGLTTIGGSAPLSVSFYDYQGIYTISSVKAYCSDLFNSPITLSQITSDGNNATFGATVTNQKMAPAGTYDILVEVVDTEDANYPEMVASYVTLTAQVVEEVVNVVITLAEDDNTKTPGNWFNMKTYSGLADYSIMNYNDYDGPWDFTSIVYSDMGTRKSLATNDPEVTGFAGNFPNAQHFLKNFLEGVGSIYQAESHDYAKNTLKEYGMYESETLGGAVVFTGTLDGFPYPYNTSTSFKRSYKTTLQGLPSTVAWDSRALGQGLCKIPLNGGTTKGALMVRTIIDVKILLVSTLKVLMYEWYDDDGNLVASIASVNIAGETANWNESTYQITQTGAITSLYELYRQ
jgi:hypothetical protein